MVKINYNEKPCIFHFQFDLKEYVPDKYFKNYKNQIAIELCFFIDLFIQKGILDDKDSSTPMIWSTHYACHYRGIPFVMVYDEDYGFITFAVHDPEARLEVADALKQVIENAKL